MRSFDGLNELVQSLTKFIISTGDVFIPALIKGFSLEEQIKVFPGFIARRKSINEEFNELQFVSSTTEAFDDVG
jgi:hypothetical protein